MESKGRSIASIVLILAVMGYTVYNYVVGKTDTTMFVVCMVIMGLPLINIINITIRNWRDGK